MRTYGHIERQDDKWVITTLEPHVAIRLKANFNRIPKNKAAPFTLDGTDEVSNELRWFLDRYPLEISASDQAQMNLEADRFDATRRELEQILVPDYKPSELKIRGELRNYQAVGADLFLKTRRLLIGDAVSLGKTVTALAALTDIKTRPTVVVVQAHLTHQWAAQVEKFLGLTSHIIKGTKPYTLPSAEIYITTYSRLSGWVDYFQTAKFPCVVFDECQELRRSESQKYAAAEVLSSVAQYVCGLSATPVYNRGSEIFNILNLIKPGCLGDYDDFSREWCGYGDSVKQPKALGSYLREQHLFLRRTREDVGRELPPVNKIVHTVGYDEEKVDSVLELARTLAVKATTGSFVERGEASRELDIMMRLVTGVSKAKYVAEYVKILLENNEPVLLGLWHRDVYEIILKELADYKPVMYTGSESPAQKEASKRAFLAGESNLMLISLRSGIGLDGLQERCRYVVLGELDWSPAVLEQLIGRVDRDGQDSQVTAIYLVSDGGSDPLMVDLLGLKSSEAAGIIDPFTATSCQHSDESRVRALAEMVLKKHGLPITESMHMDGAPRGESPAEQPATVLQMELLGQASSEAEELEERSG